MDICYTVHDVDAEMGLLRKGTLSELITLVDNHWLCSIMLYFGETLVGSGFYYATCSEEGTPGLESVYEKAEALGLGQLVSEHIAGQRVIVF